MIVTSDHGLIENGHGGDSPDERLSMLFAYSSRGFSSNKVPQVPDEKASIALSLSDQISAFDITDLVSYYLGYTPPFNSLGNLRMGFMPLYLPTSDQPRETGADSELTFGEIQQLYFNYQREALKQKIALANSHNLRPDE